MERQLLDLLSRLKSSSDLGASAQEVVPACVAELQTVLQSSAGPAPEPLRGIVHRRSEAGYEGLAVVELGASRHTESELGPTSSAWQLASSNLRPVLIDVLEQRAWVIGNEGGVKGLEIGSVMTSRSRDVLSKRRATHVLVFPLTDIAGAPKATLSLELRVSARYAPPPSSWREAAAAVASLLEIVAPYLVGKPASPPRRHPEDALLPVVGELMASRLDALERLARFGDTLLLQGSPGTGKSKLARWIHQRSGRKGPFLAIGAAHLTHEFAEGDLFGWRKGAHSMATSDRAGHIASCRHGTLLIDEIDLLPNPLQGRLLRVLEEETYLPMGSDQEEVANVRFLFSTNTDLQKEVTANRFRRDLLSRIGVVSFEVPALEARRDEIRRWARLMLAEKLEKLDVPPMDLTEDALRVLETHSWPDNLRQLERVVRTAAAHALGSSTGAVDLGAVLTAIASDFNIPAIDRLEERFSALGALVAAEAIRRCAVGAQPIRLKDAEILRHYALRAAKARLGSARAALLAFGEQDLVESRNEHAELRRAEREILAFEAWLRQP